MEKKCRFFIEDSLKKPLFNNAMEKELINITKWLKTQPSYPLGKKMIADIVSVIMEIVELNSRLLKNNNFSYAAACSDNQNDYSGNYCDKFIKDYKSINSEIEIADAGCSFYKKYFSRETEQYFDVIINKLYVLSGIFSNPYSDYNNDWKNYYFLYAFFINLYFGNKKIKRKEHL